MLEDDSNYYALFYRGELAETDGVYFYLVNPMTNRLYVFSVVI